MPAAYPQFLQGNNTGALRQFRQQLPGMFDTSALTNAYQSQATSNLSNQRALAAAAGASYANRAQQSGASSLGAGFAQAQAMLPVYGMNNALMSDLATKQLQARTAQAGIGSDVAGRIGSLGAAHQGTLAEFLLGRQRNQLSGRQLGQQATQFNADLGFRNQQLEQQGSQFDRNLSLERDEFDLKKLLSAMGLSGGTGGGLGGVQRSTNFTPGYLPNIGPITPATGWLNQGGKSFTASGNNVIYG